jgi:putative membrane protein
MKRFGLLSLAVASVVTCGCHDARNNNAANAPATGSAVGTSGTATDVSRGDKDFVHDVAIANMAEIDLGQVASERGSTPEVKKFAQMMVDDHTAANDKLKAIATPRAIEVPAQLDDTHQDTRQKLEKKQALDFDRDYADMMVDGHQDFVDKLESRIDKSKLSDWKARQTDASGRKVETQADAIAITPEKSDDPVTMSINQWAADTYPTAFAHLEAAKVLQKGLKKRSTD